ncbi:hypothetical protein [Edaphosphingomonas haloaromaticamans]|uniref:Uncharacterized protein n=1 Tax=Edaphosphingomonas haloaromaticamans TaxID=653954 RepID=A0A1S1HCK2_9SPHN|nr:hypothetical protein [Sphingomonas haloaromaticamans]OHT19924.1 hypothetical protein BHE75_01917 [Sphingomonas haloaromaticamans]
MACHGLDVRRLVDSYERGLVPLAQAEPGGKSARDPQKDGKLSRGLGDDLAMIATKLNPTMTADQADAWIKATTYSLGDLPGRVAREAAQAVLRRWKYPAIRDDGAVVMKPIRFFPEVDPAIRAVAADIMARHRTALMRLRALEQAIADAGRPALEAPKDEALSADEIASANAAFARLGIRTRYAADGSAYEIDRPRQDDRGNETEEAKAA